MDTPTISYDDSSLSAEYEDHTTQTDDVCCLQPPLKKRKLEETEFLDISSEESGLRRSSRRSLANPRFANAYLEEPSRRVRPIAPKASLAEKKDKFCDMIERMAEEGDFTAKRAEDLVSALFSFLQIANKPKISSNIFKCLYDPVRTLRKSWSDQIWSRFADRAIRPGVVRKMKGTGLV